MAANTAFQRGGALPTKASSGRSAAEDLLFGSKRAKLIEVVDKKKKPKSKNNNGTPAASLSAIASVGLGMTRSAANDKTLKIESVSFKKYSQGVLALGYVLSISDTGLTISLPGGVTGNVSANEVSDYFYQKFSEQTYQARIPELKDIISLWQPVRVYVLGLVDSKSGKKAISLSMRASLIYRGVALKHLYPGFPVSGCVSSVEDHGIVISSGISGVTCFMPAKSIPAALGEMKLGRPIECIVDEINEVSRIITLRAQRKSVQETVTRGNNLSFLSLHPGIMVSAVIDNVVNNGIIVSFMGTFHGVIDMSSLPRPMTSLELKEAFSAGDIIQTRLVFVDHASKSCRLSLRPHVIEFRAPKGLPSLGDKLEGITVVNVQRKLSLLATKSSVNAMDTTEDNNNNNNTGSGGTGKKKAQMEMKQKREQDEQQLSIFMHKSNIFDPSTGAAVAITDLDKTFKAGTEIPEVRVIGYHIVEGLVLASNQPSVLSGEVIHASQIQPGQIHEAVVTGIKDFGLQLKIGGRINVICPALHLSDTGLTTTKLGKLFKIGQKMQVRVWEKNNDGMIVVTHKKALLGKDKNIFTSYDEVKEGMTSTGVISDLNADGIRVHFCNRVRGYIPNSILVKQGVLDIHESYRVGQLINCAVVKTFEQIIAVRKGNEKTRIRLILALDLGNLESLKALAKKEKQKLLSLPEDAESEDEMDETTKQALKDADSENFNNEEAEENEEDKPHKQAPSALFEKVSGTILKFQDDVYHIRLTDGRLAHLTKHHIYDFAATSDALAVENKSHPFEVGNTLSDMVVIGKMKKIILVTMKPLLLGSYAHTGESALGSEDLPLWPKSPSEVSPGKIVVGYVYKIESFGVLIKFNETFTALVPRPNLADKFINSPVGLFNIGDSIRCVVQRVDLHEEKVILSCKPSFTPSSMGSNCFLASYLKEKYFVSAHAALQSKKIFPDFNKYSLGSVVSASITSINSYGIVLLAEDETTVMFAKNAEKGTNKVGERVRVRILDIDFDSLAILVSLKTDLLGLAPPVKAAEKTPKKKKGKTAAEEEVVKIGDNSFAEVNTTQNVTVELIQSNYLVVSSSNHGSIGVVSIADYNCPTNTSTGYEIGQTLSAKIVKAATPADSSFPHGNVAILAPITATNQSLQKSKTMKESASDPNKNEAVGMQHRQKFLLSLRVGSIMPWTVTSISNLELKLKPLHAEAMGLDVKASLHISNSVDSLSSIDTILEDMKSVQRDADRFGISTNHPFHGIKERSRLLCRVLKVRKSSGDDSNDNNDVDENESSYSVTLELVSKTKEENSDEESSVSKSRGLVHWDGQGKILAGSMYAGVITHIESLYVTLALSPYVSGRLMYTDLSTNMEFAKSFRESCFVGQRIIVGVKSVSMTSSTTTNTRHLILTRSHVEEVLKANKDNVDLSKFRNVSFDTNATWEVGQTVVGQIDFASKVAKPPAIMIALGNGKFGRVCATELEDRANWRDLADFFNDMTKRTNATTKEGHSLQGVRLPYGQAHGDFVTCRVLSVDGQQVDLTMRPSRMTKAKAGKVSKGKKVAEDTSALAADIMPSVGDVVSAYVSNTSAKGCFLKMDATHYGMVLIRDLSDDFVAKPEVTFPCGRLVQARVVSVDPADQRIKLTLKSSTIHGDVKSKKELESLHEGQVVVGTVQRITDFGVFVAIQKTSLIGLSRLPQALPKNSTKSLKDMYEVGDVVKAKVLSVSLESRKISLGLKPNYFADEESEDSEEEDKESEEMEVDNDDHNEDAMDVDEDSDDDDDEEDEEDDEEGVDFTLLDDDDEDSDDEDIKKIIKKASLKTESDDEEDDDDEDDEDEDDEDEDDEDEDEEDEEEEEPAPAKNKKRVAEESKSSDKTKKLKVESGDNKKKSSGAQLSMDWDDFNPNQTGRNSNDNDDEDSEAEADSDSENDTRGKGHKQRVKEAEKKREEAEIRRRENALVSGEFVPESATDYERMLLSQPNASYLWIQFMAFHLKTADITNARIIAERALKTINFREEDEKFNVWVAWLNMEHKFGDSNSLENVFKKAILESKGQEIHLHMCELYEQANDVINAEAMFQKTLKKFKASKDVWIAFQQFRLRNGNVKGAEDLLSRSMQSLPKTEHVDVVMKFALYQYDLNKYDKGRFHFEELIAENPKRSDIWNVYIDKEIKVGEFKQARKIFERMLTCQFPVKTMKLVFKKYLDFEMKHGSEAAQEKVKEKAREYVSKMM